MPSWGSGCLRSSQKHARKTLVSCFLTSSAFAFFLFFSQARVVGKCPNRGKGRYARFWAWPSFFFLSLSRVFESFTRRFSSWLAKGKQITKLGNTPEIGEKDVVEGQEQLVLVRIGKKQLKSM